MDVGIHRLNTRADAKQVPESAWNGLRVHDLAEVAAVTLAPSPAA